MVRAMRAMVMAVAAMVAVAGAASAKLPRDADEFREQMRQRATKPDGAAKLFFEAVYTYVKDGTRDAGRKMLSAILVDGSWERNSYFVDRMRTKPYIFRSYARGATPENSYAMNPDSFDLAVVGSASDSYRDGAWRVDLKSGGADAKRGLVLTKGADGLWRVQVYNDIYADVKPPAA